MTRTKLMTAADVAEELNVHFRTVYRLRRAGELPAVAIGGSWRYKPSDVQRLIRKLTVRQTP